MLRFKYEWSCASTPEYAFMVCKGTTVVLFRLIVYVAALRKEGAGNASGTLVMHAEVRDVTGLLRNVKP